MASSKKVTFSVLSWEQPEGVGARVRRSIGRPEVCCRLGESAILSWRTWLVIWGVGTEVRAAGAAELADLCAALSQPHPTSARLAVCLSMRSVSDAHSAVCMPTVHSIASHYVNYSWFLRENMMGEACS